MQKLLLTSILLGCLTLEFASASLSLNKGVDKEISEEKEGLKNSGKQEDQGVDAAIDKVKQVAKKVKQVVDKVKYCYVGAKAKVDPQATKFCVDKCYVIHCAGATKSYPEWDRGCLNLKPCSIRRLSCVLRGGKASCNTCEGDKCNDKNELASSGVGANLASAMTILILAGIATLFSL